MSTPPSDAGGRVRADLLPGEHLLWEGRPDPRAHFTTADAFIVPFSILWLGFATSWVVEASRAAGFGFASFGLLFVAVGLYLVFGRFVHKQRTKRLTAYGVTDRRVIVATGSSSTSQVPILNQPITVRRRGGRVSVTVGPTPPFRNAVSANTGLDLWSRDTGTVGLWDVEDGQGLLTALRRAQSL